MNMVLKNEILKSFFGLILLFILAYLTIVIFNWQVNSARFESCADNKLNPLSHSVISIQLKRQHPSKPKFESSLTYWAVSKKTPEAQEIELIFSYGNKQLNRLIEIPVRAEERVINGENYIETRAKNWKDISLLTNNVSHRNFPFDSPEFYFKISGIPQVAPQHIILTNNDDNFILNCSDVKWNPSTDGGVLEFKLERNELVQFWAILLIFAILLFLIFILKLKNKSELAMALSSYFFTLWSTRNILESQIKFFPTLFDCVILVVSLILILVAVYKLLLFPNQ